MGKLFTRLTSFRGRWNAAKHRADRIAMAIARDQMVAWALHPDSRRRNQALRGWSDMLRAMVPA
jgi:hypothetical protein